MPFIARARYEAQNYDHVVVRCEEPFPYLYRDFAHEIITYPVKSGKRDRWLYNKEAPKYSRGVAEIHARLRKEYDKVKLFYPTEDRCKRKEVKWFKYGNPGLHQEPSTGDGLLGNEETLSNIEILFHSRNLPKAWYDRKWVRGTRNWSDINWGYLSGRFQNNRVASIGSKEGAKHILFTEDLRGIGIEGLCNHMANAKVIVGPSSGPMHLAMLCGCPTVVWTHNIKEKSLDRKTNRWRYEQFMNPFNTPVTVIDNHGWNPPVEAVVGAVEKYL